MESFDEVHLGFTMIDACGGHGIVFVTEQVVSDEAAKQRVYDERPRDREACRVVGAEVKDVCISCLFRNCEEKSDSPGH